MDPGQNLLKRRNLFVLRMGTWKGVLLSSGCRNKMPSTGGLNNSNLRLTVLGVEVQDQGAIVVGVW